MSIPSIAKSAKHRVKLVYNNGKHGIKDSKDLFFTVKNEGGWDKDPLIDQLKNTFSGVVMLQNGLPCKTLGIANYEGISETYLFSTHRVGDRNSDYVNHGACSALWIGNYAQTQRALFKFDLRKIPTSSVVQKAFLKVYMFQKGSGRGRPRVNALQAFEVLKAWEGGRGQGLWPKGGHRRVPRVKSGEASWNCSAHPTKWNKPGCGGIGTDRADKVLGQGAPPQGKKGWVTIELDKTIVQRWIKDPTSNKGILLKDAKESGGSKSAYRSSEFSDIAFRPRLILAFPKGVGK